MRFFEKRNNIGLCDKMSLCFKIPHFLSEISIKKKQAWQNKNVLNLGGGHMGFILLFFCEKCKNNTSGSIEETG